ncbi:E3 ubiquitin-protein ligase RAD18 isoform X2 [Dunckerocampus dactyliophorus]|uniref:E3 ubiquitin-protein ligase RAD18 isoform X2 n=1 Tax=Dunckerocampus dactyliophorus TaxID=161453 RepID=UPI0024076950|nr:E3 ubiquitin-protein ligase RAD18 isoform X2 [Dunckerocampus dactyliophorus]
MDIQTESDPPPTITCLKNFDALLRCPICFDFLNISMMTKCSHNFCSLCIRKFFSYKLQCPVCNVQATEQDLRNNRLLDDLVVSFRAARQQLSKTHFESPPISPKNPGSAKCKAPRDKGQKCSSSVASHFFQKRPRTSPAKENQTDGSLAVQRSTRTHNANNTDAHSVTVKEEAMEVEEASIRGVVSVKWEDTALHSISTEEERPHSSSSTSNDDKPGIKVKCPVCSVGVSQQFINKHLDMCLTSGEKKESLRSSFGKSRRPMGKLVYNLMSVLELKRRLKECHLSVHGSRDQLIKRHKEFVHVYNAQCDSLNPKSAKDIAKEVEANERIKNQLQNKSKPVMVFSKNHSEEEIDEVHSKYHQVEDSRNCTDISVEEMMEEKEPSARRYVLSNSPTYSDVSVSSSISDIFAPDPSRNNVTEKPSVTKQATCPRKSITASSPAVGERRRKTRLTEDRTRARQDLT